MNIKMARKVYVEELVKNSMIEFLEDAEIRKLTKTIKEESEYPLINYNFWTKTKDFESIIKTNRFFIEMKTTIIDHTVKNNETVLQSLVKAMEDHQHENKEKLIETLEKCYYELTIPTEETLNCIAIQIFNKGLEEIYYTTICWILTLNTDIFIDLVFRNLKKIKKTKRDSDGKYRDIEVIKKILKIIKRGPKLENNKEFVLFFKKYKWDFKNTYKLFNEKMAQFIYSLDDDYYEEIEIDDDYTESNNLDILGGILGSLDKMTFTESIKYCKSKIKKPEILLNFISHSNSYTIELVDELIYICRNLKEFDLKMRARYMIEKDLSIVFNSFDIDEIEYRNKNRIMNKNFEKNINKNKKIKK
jgi:hypothetical protein